MASPRKRKRNVLCEITQQAENVVLAQPVLNDDKPPSLPSFSAFNQLQQEMERIRCKSLSESNFIALL
jgi:hypothetical protein